MVYVLLVLAAGLAACDSKEGDTSPVSRRPSRSAAELKNPDALSNDQGADAPLAPRLTRPPTAFNVPARYLGRPVIAPNATAIVATWFHLYGEEPNFEWYARQADAYLAVEDAAPQRQREVLSKLIPQVRAQYDNTPRDALFWVGGSVMLGAYDESKGAFPMSGLSRRLVAWPSLAWGPVQEQNPREFNPAVVVMSMGSGEGVGGGAGEIPDSLRLLPMSPEQAKQLIERNGGSPILRAMAVVQPVRPVRFQAHFDLLTRVVWLELRDANNELVAVLEGAPLSPAKLRDELAWHNAMPAGFTFERILTTWAAMRGVRYTTEQLQAMSPPALARSERFSQAFTPLSLASRYARPPLKLLKSTTPAETYYDRRLGVLRVLSVREEPYDLRVSSPASPFMNDRVWEPESMFVQWDAPPPLEIPMTWERAMEVAPTRREIDPDAEIVQLGPVRYQRLLLPVAAELQPVEGFDGQVVGRRRVLIAKPIGDRLYTRRPRDHRIVFHQNVRWPEGDGEGQVPAQGTEGNGTTPISPGD